MKNSQMANTLCNGCEFWRQNIIKCVDELPNLINPVSNFCVNEKTLPYPKNSDMWCHGEPQRLIGYGKEIKKPEWCLMSCEKQ